MDSKVIQEFKGTINDVEFDNKSLYYATETILNGIEEKKNVPMDDKTLTANFKSALEDYFYKADGAVDLESIGYVTYESLTNEPTLKDVRIIDEYNNDLSEYRFESINELITDLSNGKYEHLVPQKENQQEITPENAFKDLAVTIQWLDGTSDKPNSVRLDGSDYTKNEPYKGLEAYELLEKLVKEDQRLLTKNTPEAFREVEFSVAYEDRPIVHERLDLGDGDLSRPRLDADVHTLPVLENRPNGYPLSHLANYLERAEDTKALEKLTPLLEKQKVLIDKGELRNVLEEKTKKQTISFPSRSAGNEKSFER